MAKNNKEHRQSERKKYLRTLMADMGLESLSDLPKDERDRWARAAEPSNAVKKKLKEMGYSINSDTNKRSLGRLSRLAEINKTAAKNNLLELRSMIGPDAYASVVSQIFNSLSLNNNFDSKTYADNIISQIKLKTNKPFDENKAREILSTAYTGMVQLSLDLSTIFAKNYQAEFDVKRLSDKNKQTIILYLMKLKYLQDNRPNKKQLSDAIISFQSANGLNPNGLINKATYDKLDQLSFGIPDPVIPEKKQKKNAPIPDGEKVRRKDRRKAEDFNKSQIKNLKFGPRVDLDTSRQETRDMVSILDYVAGRLGVRGAVVTSAYRSPWNQARVMHKNYSRRGGGEAGKRYLAKLYGNKGVPIADIFNKNRKNPDAAIDEASKAITPSNGWRGSHLTGVAIDIAGSPSKGEFDNMIREAERYMRFKKILWEKDHYHLEVSEILGFPGRANLS